MDSDLMFPASQGYELISEPGTFFVGSALSLCAKVVGKRDLRGSNSLSLSPSPPFTDAKI